MRLGQLQATLRSNGIAFMYVRRFMSRARSGLTGQVHNERRSEAALGSTQRLVKMDTDPRE
jgi:hypothetical protein